MDDVDDGDGDGDGVFDFQECVKIKPDAHQSHLSQRDHLPRETRNNLTARDDKFKQVFNITIVINRYF